MGMALNYREPKNVRQLAHAINVFLIDQWRFAVSICADDHKSEFNVCLDDAGDTVVLVCSLGYYRTLTNPPDKELPWKHKLAWLSEDEEDLIWRLRRAHFYPGEVIQNLIEHSPFSFTKERLAEPANVEPASNGTSNGAPKRKGRAKKTG